MVFYLRLEEGDSLGARSAPWTRSRFAHDFEVEVLKDEKTCLACPEVYKFVAL